MAELEQKIIPDHFTTIPERENPYDNAYKFKKTCDNLDIQVAEFGLFHPKSTQLLDRASLILQTSPGSPVFSHHLQDKLQQHGPYRPFRQLPYSFGIETEDIPNPGIFSSEGAKKYELRHLIIVEPTAIRGLLRQGMIGEAERTSQAYQEWANSFKDHYGERFDTDENLSNFYQNPDDRVNWRRKVRPNIA